MVFHFSAVNGYGYEYLFLNLLYFLTASLVPKPCAPSREAVTTPPAFPCTTLLLFPLTHINDHSFHN